MTEELEETISKLRRELLDAREELIKKDRQIYSLEDEVTRLKRQIRGTTAEVNKPKETTKEIMPKPKETTMTVVKPKQEPKPTPPPRSTSVESTKSSSNPLLDFEDDFEMDDEAHLDELLNGGPSTPEPVQVSRDVPSTPPRAAKPQVPSTPPRARVEVYGTPEKERHRAVQIRQEVIQKQQYEAEQARRAKQVLEIKKVDVMVKKESDHGAFSRKVLEKSKKSKDMDSDLMKRIEAKAAKVSANNIEKSKEKKLLKSFISQGREYMERGVVDHEPEEDEESDGDNYMLNQQQVTHMGVTEDPVALRREADMKKKDLEDISLFFLRERFLTKDEVEIMTEDMKVYTVTECLRAARGGVEIEDPSFAVVGVILNKATKIYSNQGESRKVVQMRIADVASMKEEWSVSLSANAEAVDVVLGWALGAVVCIVNPSLRLFKQADKDSEETAFSISSGSNNFAFEIGITADVGRCEATTRTGEQCKRIVYKRKLNMCIQHAALMKNKKKDDKTRLKSVDGSALPPTSTRPEFNSVPNLPKGTKVTSFKPSGPVQSKSFKRPSEAENLRQLKENRKVTEDLLNSNPQAAQMFGKTETRPMPKHMSHHKHPDDPKVSTLAGDKRMSEYVLAKGPEHEKRPRYTAMAPPKEPAAMRDKKELREMKAAAIQKALLSAKNGKLSDSDSDDELEFIEG